MKTMAIILSRDGLAAAAKVILSRPIREESLLWRTRRPCGPTQPDLQVVIDTSRPHQARVYDYLLGGKDNFAVDREAAERALAVYPGLRRGVRAQRAFLANAVDYLARTAGITQFLDIGTGIPTANIAHEVAHAVDQEARIVYVDNDPVVLAHARALRTGSRPGYDELSRRRPA
jgi:S-adenosyl methyltransferase